MVRKIAGKKSQICSECPPPGSKNTAWASRAALWRDFRAPTPAGERNTEVTIYNPQLFFFFFSKAAQLRGVCNNKFNCSQLAILSLGSAVCQSSNIHKV